MNQWQPDDTPVQFNNIAQAPPRRPVKKQNSIESQKRPRATTVKISNFLKEQRSLKPLSITKPNSRLEESAPKSRNRIT